MVVHNCNPSTWEAEAGRKERNEGRRERKGGKENSQEGLMAEFIR
jgi:hypothetical protein